jgi:hypothetical protein
VLVHRCGCAPPLVLPKGVPASSVKPGQGPVDCVVIEQLARFVSMVVVSTRTATDCGPSVVRFESPGPARVRAPRVRHSLAFAPVGVGQIASSFDAGPPTAGRSNAPASTSSPPSASPSRSAAADESGPTVPSMPAGWVEVRLGDAATISMTAKPEKKVQDVTLDDGSSIESTVYGIAGDTDYGVNVTVYPSPKHVAEPDDLFDAARDPIVKRVDGEVVEERDVPVEGADAAHHVVVRTSTGEIIMTRVCARRSAAIQPRGGRQTRRCCLASFRIP